MGKELKRTFRGSDSEFVITVGKQIGSMRRDIAGFATLGVTSTEIDAYEQENIDFSNLTTDDEERADVEELVENKDNTIKELIEKTKFVGDRAKLKFKESSAKYRAFKMKGLDNLGDANLVFAAKCCLARGIKHQLLLQDLGVTTTVLDELAALIEVYIAALEAVHQAEGDREENTEMRVLAANTLHAKYVDYNAKGKILWKNSSEARWNDYLENKD